MMFAGLTSRWMTPCACRWSTASASARGGSPGRRRVGAGRRAMRCARLGPSTYSMTSSTAPSCSIASKSFTTFGWLSDAATRISRRKRGATSAPESGCRRLIATRRPSSTSSARNTDAIAPAPSRRIIRKRPATSRESRRHGVDMPVAARPLTPRRRGARAPRAAAAGSRRRGASRGRRTRGRTSPSPPGSSPPGRKSPIS